jgi:superfamily II DNA or RNA helicase
MTVDHPLLRLLAGFRASEGAGRQGRSFERLMAWWLVNDPEFKARFARVERPLRDIGIDLLAFPHDGGKPTAVQCKHHGREIPKSEINSFLSAAATDAYAGSLLIHTGTGFSRNAEETIASQKVPCSVVTLTRLLRSDVEWPGSVNRLDAGVPLAARAPRAHQQEAVDSIRSTFRSGRGRTWIDMACGSGKTLVGTLVADEFADEFAVVFLATIPGVHETVRAWRRDAQRPFAELRVCSQKEAGDRELLSFEEVQAEVTTSSSQIATFLRGSGRRVVFCTYASAPRVARAALDVGVTFDLVVADDVHRLSSRRLSDEARSVLDDACLPARKRLFMTATPRSIEPQTVRAAKRRNAPLVDMRDHGGGDFGNRTYRLSHREAVEREAVLPFEVHVVKITTTEVERIVASRRMVAGASHDEAVLASLATTQVAVVKAARDLQLRRIVAFHAHVADSKIFASQFDATARLVRGIASAPAARHVARDDRRRRRTIQWFETSEGPCLLSNVKLLAEGIDSPDIDAIIWNDPRPPANRLVQAVGRALRPAAGKTKAVVIVPMVVGPDGNVARAREFSDFRSTVQILAALRTIDPQFTISRESFRFYAAKHAQSSVGRYVPDEESIVAPLEVTDAFADAIEPLLMPSRAPTLTLVRPSRRAQRPTPRTRASQRHRPVRAGATSRSKHSVDIPYFDRMFADGLERLEDLSGDQLLFEFNDHGWLRLLKHLVRKRRLHQDQLQRVASHLSFLSSGLGQRSCELRAVLAWNSERDVPTQLAAWIRARPSASHAHALHAIAYDLRWPVSDIVSDLHSMLTHPGIDPVSQARLSLQPLLVATEGIGRDEDPSSRLAGVLAALQHPWDAAPRHGNDGWRPDAPTDAGRADWQTYAAGWEAAEPWRAQARLISRLDLRTYKTQIAAEVARQASLPRGRRWDCTAWIVYIDDLARTAGGTGGARRSASMLPYKARVHRARHLLSTPAPALAAA